MKMHYFHFTIGPVQTFVGQARRTKDFWAGSFLLSWLAGVAMVSVQQQQGTILFPQADPDFLTAIKSGAQNGPKQGTIPNRFKAEVGPDFKPEQVVSEVQAAWNGLAQAVYQADIEPHASSEVKTIWDRQVAHFWDMAWVLTGDVKDSNSLDRRKNWRSQYLPDEPGQKCSLMADWQELSGIVGVSSADRKKRESFWEKVGEKTGLDSIEQECLCAMAYIKRRFNIYFNSALVVKLNGWQAHGWATPQSVPSVPRLAAAHWYATLLDKEHSGPLSAKKASEDWKAFFSEAKTLSGLPEKGATLQCIEETESADSNYKWLDGNVFFEDALNNPNIFSLSKQAQAETVRNLLRGFYKKYGKPSPFYAVVAMDGDRLGEQMGNPEKQTLISEALAQFTKNAPTLVQKRSGFLIYAGGDDVLALTPLEDALTCAKEIRQEYVKAFAGKEGITTSISAAILYTHITTPLANILHDAHSLLEKVAKDGAGRDAFAVRVVKGSGQIMQWAKKWETQDDQEGNNSGIDNVAALYKLVKQFRDQDSASDQQFSSKFFFKIRQRFDLLYPRGNQQQGNPLSQEQCLDLMAMEYRKSSANSKMTMATARQAIGLLMDLSFDDARGRITADVALFLRFLVHKGMEGGCS